MDHGQSSACDAGGAVVCMHKHLLDPHLGRPQLLLELRDGRRQRRLARRTLHDEIEQLALEKLCVVTTPPATQPRVTQQNATWSHANHVIDANRARMR